MHVSLSPPLFAEEWGDCARSCSAAFLLATDVTCVGEPGEPNERQAARGHGPAHERRAGWGVLVEGVVEFGPARRTL